MIVFLTAEQVIDVHDRVLQSTGVGVPGVRDGNLLRSAIQRPDDKAYYEPGASLAELAASLAFGLAKNHAFLDANKRTTAVSLELFLALNGFELTASDDDIFEMVIGLASDHLSEDELTSWIAARLSPVPKADSPR